MLRISPLLWRIGTALPRMLLLLGAINVLRLLFLWSKELRAIGRRRPMTPGPSLRV
jgi:hypothetical protein